MVRELLSAAAAVVVIGATAVGILALTVAVTVARQEARLRGTAYNDPLPDLYRRRRSWTGKGKP